MAHTMKKLSKVRGEHNFSLDDDFSSARKRITQTRYFKAGDVVVAIAELNSPNHWNDKAFDAACEFLQSAWNAAASPERTIHAK